LRLAPQSFVAALRRVPAKVWLRLSLLVGLLALGLVLILWTPVGEYFTEERMVALFEHLRSFWWTPLLLIAIYVVISPLGFIPTSPVLIAGGLVFGAFWGTVYNAVGLVLAAMVTFYIARALGRDFVVEIAGPRLRRAERIFHRQAFWPLVQVRFLPIPFSVVSYGAAMAGVRGSIFFAASTLGILPAAVIHTYFAPALILDPSWTLVFYYILSIVALNVIAGWQNLRERWRRRQRYRLLMAERQQRR
jgi:uncharacterized membrane protein YdjX (TVP38/TMEM64 family)